VRKLALVDDVQFIACTGLIFANRSRL
jgi:hypothetical protein